MHHSSPTWLDWWNFSPEASESERLALYSKSSTSKCFVLKGRCSVNLSEPTVTSISWVSIEVIVWEKCCLWFQGKLLASRVYDQNPQNGEARWGEVRWGERWEVREFGSRIQNREALHGSNCTLHALSEPLPSVKTPCNEVVEMLEYIWNTDQMLCIIL